MWCTYIFPLLSKLSSENSWWIQWNEWRNERKKGHHHLKRPHVGIVFMFVCPVNQQHTLFQTLLSRCADRHVCEPKRYQDIKRCAGPGQAYTHIDCKQKANKRAHTTSQSIRSNSSRIIETNAIQTVSGFIITKTNAKQNCNIYTQL